MGMGSRKHLLSKQGPGVVGMRTRVRRLGELGVGSVLESRWRGSNKKDIAMRGHFRAREKPGARETPRNPQR